MNALFLSFVIPAYNEENRLPAYLERVLEYFYRQPYTVEVIVVDDGSSDETVAIVRGFMQLHSCLRLEKLPQNWGKGCAVKRGMIAARGDFRIFADADGATPIEETERLLDAVKGGADIVIGSRAMKSDQCVVKGTLHRKIMGAIFNGIISVLAVRGFNDTQCGFKLFSASAAERLFTRQRVRGFGFDVEILFIAQKFGLRVTEVPVNWADVSGTKVRLVKDSFRMLGEVMRVRFNNIVGCYTGDPRR